jgi:hypothetical protein
VQQELARLATYIAVHPSRPDHPFLPFDRAEQLVIATSELFAALCRRCLHYPNLRAEAEALARQEQYPLRTEPALPALVQLGVVSLENALTQASNLLDANDAESQALTDMLLVEFTGLSQVQGAFNEAVTEALVLRLIANSHGVPTLLRTFWRLLRDSPERVHPRHDSELAFALRELLADTDMRHSRSGLPFDPFVARLWGAVVATRLSELGRIDADLFAAWRQACEKDPLPDARRAMQRELEAG